MTEIEVTQVDRDAAAEFLGYRDWADATDYRLTGAQDQEVRRVARAFARHRTAATAEKDAEIARLKSAVINLIGALEMENPLPWRGTINEAENALGETK